MKPFSFSLNKFQFFSARAQKWFWTKTKVTKSLNKWRLCTLRHGIQISMEAILACHPALSTEWLDLVTKWCEQWRIRTGHIWQRQDVHEDWTNRHLTDTKCDSTITPKTELQFSTTYACGLGCGKTYWWIWSYTKRKRITYCNPGKSFS